MKRRAFLKGLALSVAAVAMQLRLATGPVLAHVIEEKEPESEAVTSFSWAFPNMSRKSVNALNARRVARGLGVFEARSMEELPGDWLRWWKQKQEFIINEPLGV